MSITRQLTKYRQHTSAGQFLRLMLSASQRSRNLTASRSTRVRSFKSKTMRRPCASDLNSVSNSETFSAFIRPLSLRTSPLPDLSILSICISPVVKHDLSLCNSGTRRNPMKISGLTFRKMVIFRQLAKCRTIRCSGIPCEKAIMGLVGLGMTCSFESILIDLQ